MDLTVKKKFYPGKQPRQCVLRIEYGNRARNNQLFVSTSESLLSDGVDFEARPTRVLKLLIGLLD